MHVLSELVTKICSQSKYKIYEAYHFYHLYSFINIEECVRGFERRIHLERLFEILGEREQYVKFHILREMENELD